MHARPRLLAALTWLGPIALAWLLALAGLHARAASPEGSVTVLDSALATAGPGDHFPTDRPARNVKLPDNRWGNQPRDGGPMWYRLRFDAPRTSDPLLAIYIERVCSTAEVQLNGSVIHSGGSMNEPVTRNCFYPQLVMLPKSMLLAEGNTLDIKVQGYPLQEVSARQRSGGLSQVAIGPQPLLAEEHATRLFWNISVVQIITIATTVLGVCILFLGLLNRQEIHLIYFGLMTLAWNALSARTWMQNIPLDNGTTELLVCAGFAVSAGLAAQFLLSYAGLRSRVIEAGLLAQCVLVPLTLVMAGPQRLFTVSSAWYMLMAIEVVAIIGLYLYAEWHSRRENFWPMATMLSTVGTLILVERAIQHGWIGTPRIQVLHFALPVMFIVIGSRQLKAFGRALQAAEASRNSLESRVAEATAEMERNYVQMAELRVEQVTEKERKRIAGDLHDDLGAKLLTIVHTSESERISTLAREALEEMRLSVRGLTGKPLPVADALADWRAETVSRLGQAGVEVDWRSPTEDVTQQLSARAFVQTTRILREAVSNVIKHSGASHCKVRCTLGQQDFVLVVQDNGRGIPMELDGKLDRGHGMASMKHRAKQMQGQCLVESGPGYGTVIRLTLPLGTA
jgi:two-component system sensor histidine kinase UhpB